MRASTVARTAGGSLIRSIRKSEGKLALLLLAQLRTQIITASIRSPITLESQLPPVRRTILLLTAVTGILGTATLATRVDNPSIAAFSFAAAIILCFAALALIVRE